MYTIYRNYLTKIIKTAKNDYLKQKFEACSGNVKNTWKNINKMLGKYHQNKNKSFKIDNCIVENELEIAKAFNSYYTSIGNETVDNLPRTYRRFDEYLPQINFEEIRWNLTTEAEVKKIVLQSNDTQPGPDNIPIRIYKNNIDFLCPVIAHLCNLSLQNGTFPSVHKIGKVIPIYKNKERNELCNYRPICLLNSISKVLEKIVSVRLLNHLEVHNILANEQYAYRKSKGTDLAITDFIKNILGNFDNNHVTIAVFLDLTKAFDCVRHDILLRKLEHYGIRGTSLQWFANYLTNRKQYVKYMNAESEERPIDIGVPQGSILGPILFLVFINDFCRITNSGKELLFADDATHFDSDVDFYTVLNRVNRNLILLSEWFLANSLAINLIKSGAMVLTRKNIIFPLAPVMLQNNPIPYNYKFKFLGVMIDFKLS